MTSNLYIQFLNKDGIKSLKKSALFFLFLTSLLLINISISHADVVGQITKISTFTNEIEIEGTLYKLPTHAISSSTTGLKAGDFVSFSEKDQIIQEIKKLDGQIDTIRTR